jgi:hypothetical protein
MTVKRIIKEGMGPDMIKLRAGAAFAHRFNNSLQSIASFSPQCGDKGGISRKLLKFTQMSALDVFHVILDHNVFVVSDEFKDLEVEIDQLGDTIVLEALLPANQSNTKLRIENVSKIEAKYSKCLDFDLSFAWRKYHRISCLEHDKRVKTVSNRGPTISKYYRNKLILCKAKD